MDTPINRKFRLLSLFGEHAIMTMVGAPVMILLFPLGGNWGFYALLVLYLNKDFLQGRSPLKRMLDTQVQTSAGLPANELRCFVRNTTAMLWPLEVLVVAITGRRRLGDYIAGTQVVDIPKKAGSWKQDLALYRISSCTIYTLLATLIYQVGLYGLFKWFGL